MIVTESATSTFHRSMVLQGVNATDLWESVGKKGKHGVQGRLGGRGVQPAEIPPSMGEKSKFIKNYSWGLKNHWFSACKELERIALEEAYRAGVKCPKTALAQVPIGFNGSPEQVMDGIRVSLCRLDINGRKLKGGVNGDFRITPKECQSLFSVYFSDLEVKRQVLLKGKIPWFKKQGREDRYVMAERGELKMIDLVRPKVTLVVTHYEPENNEQYDQALRLFYAREGVEIKIEEGTREQYIDMGDGTGYKETVYSGKKFVSVQFPEGEEVGLIDGKIELYLDGIGRRTVWVNQMGKKYPCNSCGGLECDRFFCMNKCMYCRRDLRTGHKQSECEEAGLVDYKHCQKTKDIERTLKKWYMPAVVAGSSKEEMEKVLEERDDVENRLAHRMEQVINHSLKEAKGKAFGDTPYQPMEMGVRKERGVKHKKDMTDELKEVLIGKGGKKKNRTGEAEEQGEDNSSVIVVENIHEVMTQQNNVAMEVVIDGDQGTSKRKPLVNTYEKTVEGKYIFTDRDGDKFEMEQTGTDGDGGIILEGRGGERFVVAGLQDDEAGTGGSFVPK